MSCNALQRRGSRSRPGWKGDELNVAGHGGKVAAFDPVTAGYMGRSRQDENPHFPRRQHLYPSDRRISIDASRMSDAKKKPRINTTSPRPTISSTDALTPDASDSRARTKGAPGSSESS